MRSPTWTRPTGTSRRSTFRSSTRSSCNRPWRKDRLLSRGSAATPTRSSASSTTGRSATTTACRSKEKNSRFRQTSIAAITSRPTSASTGTKMIPWPSSTGQGGWPTTTGTENQCGREKPGSVRKIRCAPTGPGKPKPLANQLPTAKSKSGQSMCYKTGQIDLLLTGLSPPAFPPREYGPEAGKRNGEGDRTDANRDVPRGVLGKKSPPDEER